MAPLVALRCDGDARVGAGHVARCLSVARALRSGGADVCFVGAFEGVAARLLAEWPRAEPSPGPAGVGPDAEAALVDCYAIEDAEIAALARRIPVVAVADREGERRSGLVLDYHLDAHGPPLAGPDFAPLDPRMVAARRPRRETGRALVALGGSTAGGGLLPAVVEAVLDATALDVVVAGVHEPPAHARVEYLGPLDGLCDAYAEADLTVCGAGVSAYEAACAGIPAVLVVHADNQERVARAFTEREVFPVLDARAALDGALLRARLGEPPAPARGPRLVDGYGAFRIRDAMLGAGGSPSPPAVLRYRPAQWEDAGLLLAWRNEVDVRAVSRSTEMVTPDEHDAWLRGVLADPDRELLVVDRGGEAVGTVRFDRAGDESEISIALAPAARGRGLGRQAIRQTTELQLASRPGLRRVVARVRGDSEQSRRAFAGAGYGLGAVNDPWLMMTFARPARVEP